MPPSGGIPFGNYTLLRRLARGGMAEVFIARQKGLEGWGRRVAIKRILPHLVDSPEFTKMFLAEAKVAARLTHPNIVHIYDVGRVEDDYFIAMEFVDGVHGAQLIQHAERLAPSLLARIGADAAAALHYAHAQEARVVHRDVSPHNLMVSFDGVVKLVDFGIAKAFGASAETRPGVVKGKYAYMSPEQAMGRSLDGKSDVFSLGLVLWELCAGRYAFERGDPAGVMRAIRDGRVPKIEDAAPDLPMPLAEAVRWALVPDPEQRPTAAELGSALESFVKSSPEMATSMELASWVRARFDRSATADLPAVTEAVAATGTAAVSVTSAPVVAPAPPKLPTIASRARADTTTGRVDKTDDMTLVELLRPAPAALETDAALTALVAAAPPRPPRRRGWIAIASLVAAVVAIAIAVAAIASRTGSSTAQVAAGSLDASPLPLPLPSPSPSSDASAAVAVTSLPDAARPPDAPPAPAPASLDVITTPSDATATVAGQRLTTPATFEGLAAGAVTVHVELTGFVPVDRTLPLAAGEHRTFELTLVRKADVAIREPAAPKLGSLNARTTPYTEVYEGTHHLGQTPFADVRLPAGPHTLTFKNPGHRPVVKRIVIRAGKTTKLAFDLP